MMTWAVQAGFDNLTLHYEAHIRIAMVAHQVSFTKRPKSQVSELAEMPEEPKGWRLNRHAI